MEFYQRQMTMYQTVTRGSEADMLGLLDYLRFLIEEKVYERIMSDPKFRPSDLWKKWASETFLGFSTTNLLLQGGHRFPLAVTVPNRDLFGTGYKGTLKYLGSILKSPGSFRATNSDVTKHSRLFAEIYPAFTIPEDHLPIHAAHPLVYFRTAEAHLLSNYRGPKATMLEVGAGAAVNVAFNLAMYPNIKIYVIDLPETIYFGYCFLKSLFPNKSIALPQDAAETEQQADVTFLLPFQADSIKAGSIDFAFNMSSMQEMDIGVVNNYLELIDQKLKKGGAFQSINNKVSRYIPQNKMENYRLNLIGSNPVVKPVPFHSSLGFETISAEVIKN